MLAGTHCEAYFHRFHALIRVRSSAFTRAQLHRVPGTRASEGARESGWSAQVEAKRSRRLFISGSTYRSSNGCDRALQVGSVTSGANGRTLGSPYDCPPFAVVAAADDVAIGTSSKVCWIQRGTRSHWRAGRLACPRRVVVSLMGYTSLPTGEEGRDRTQLKQVAVPQGG